MWALVYVDDVIIIGDNDLVQEFKSELDTEFTVRHHGPISSYCGLEFTRNEKEGTGKISMKKYTQKVAEEFLPKGIRPVSCPFSENDSFSKQDEPTDPQEIEKMKKLPYRRLVACLLWISTTVRSDVAFPVKKLSQHFNNPGMKMWKCAIKTLAYVASNILELNYTSDSGWSNKLKDMAPPLKIYVDADYAADRDTRRSTSGVMAFHRINMVNWLVKNQKSVALSTMEAEYMALCEASKEAVYLRQLFSEIGLMQSDESVLILEDNLACRYIATDAKHHSRAKHIDIQYHFARECNQLGKTKVTEVHTQRQLADYLTKYISGTVLHRLTKAAFGYDKDFHFQEHKQPIAPMNNGLSKSKAK